MDFSTIRYELADGIATVTLNRPEVMNALNRVMRAELRIAIDHATTHARVLVLTGEGRSFCSGQDLTDASNPAEVDFERTLREEYEPLLLSIVECPVPVLAAVNGAAAGAGANLALACDLVIAAETASFIQAFTRIGLMPDAGGTWWLPRQVGLPRAMGAMLLGDRIPAPQARDWGMIWDCVPDHEFHATMRAYAQRLAEGPTLAYRHIKRALSGSFDNDLRAQLALEAQGQGACGASADFLEGVTAFLQKRPARFTGG